jgi:transcriptional regulator with XRE-family HTH domain
VTDNPDLLAAGREIRRHRLLRNLSQEQLAERAGLHRNYVGFLERGERNASLTTLFAISRALDMSLPALLECLAYETAPVPTKSQTRRPRRMAS